jgi:transcriptional regulator with XRE-family HTH domain
LPFCHITLHGQKPLPKAYPRELRTLGDHLRKRRLDLGLLQRGVALILGVEEATIWNWEKNYSSPKLHYIPRIIKFLGYVPIKVESKTLGERIVNYRRLSGITQKGLAKSLGVDPSTLGRWERDKGRPLKRHMAKLTTFLTSQQCYMGSVRQSDCAKIESSILTDR